MNAFWFKLFGVSLTSLIVLNLAILAAVLAGIHHLLRISTDRLTATVATLSVMLLFGFSQYVETGNYNFVAPYAHETTHGIALTVAILIALYHGVVARGHHCSPSPADGLAFSYSPNPRRHWLRLRQSLSDSARRHFSDPTSEGVSAEAFWCS